nr:hypothetical 19.1K protein - Thermus aquaticus [Thermus aquaticus]
MPAPRVTHNFRQVEDRELGDEGDLGPQVQVVHHKAPAQAVNAVPQSPRRHQGKAQGKGRGVAAEAQEVEENAPHEKAHPAQDLGLVLKEAKARPGVSDQGEVEEVPQEGPRDGGEFSRPQSFRICPKPKRRGTSTVGIPKSLTCAILLRVCLRAGGCHVQGVRDQRKAAHRGQQH